MGRELFFGLLRLLQSLVMTGIATANIMKQSIFLEVPYSIKISINKK